MNRADVVCPNGIRPQVSPVKQRSHSERCQLVASAKPRVLITADTASWIIGQMAMEIIRTFGDRYEFWFFTDKLLKIRPDVVRALTPTLSFTFPLTDQGVKLLERAMHPVKRPYMFWMRHITTWTADMQHAVENADEVVVARRLEAPAM